MRRQHPLSLPAPSRPQYPQVGCGETTFALLSWGLLEEKAGGIPEIGPFAPTGSGVPGPRPLSVWPNMCTPCLCWWGPGILPTRPFPQFLGLLSVMQACPGSAEVALGQCGHACSRAWPGSQVPSPAWCPQGSSPSLTRAVPTGWFFRGFWSGLATA